MQLECDDRHACKNGCGERMDGWRVDSCGICEHHCSFSRTVLRNLLFFLCLYNCIIQMVAEAMLSTFFMASTVSTFTVSAQHEWCKKGKREVGERRMGREESKPCRIGGKERKVRVLSPI